MTAPFRRGDFPELAEATDKVTLTAEAIGRLGSAIQSVHLRFSEYRRAFRILYRPRRRAFGRALHRARVKAGLSRHPGPGGSAFIRSIMMEEK